MCRTVAIVFMLVALAPTIWSKNEESLQALKERAQTANLEDRAGICVHIAELQTRAVDQFFTEGKAEEARAALDDVVSYSEKARDAATKSGKKLKHTEIAVRKMARKLQDIKRTVAFDEQGLVQAAIDRLEQVRNDLLAKMFGKGEK